jgi:hypothetical protein
MAAQSIDLLDLRPANISTDSLYLDPNNPRLAGISESQVIPDEAITRVELQTRLMAELREIGISDVVDKIKKLGYISIDRIVVRPIKGKPERFVVLEGNRRLAALRSLRENASVLATVSSEVKNSLDKIDSLVYEGDDSDIAWIIQGFRHIESIKEWGPFQQGRYLVDLQKRRGFDINEVADVAGIGRVKVSRLIRSYYGWQQARNDQDYGDQVDEHDFSVFQEAIFHQNNSPLWQWLAWDDRERRFHGAPRLGTLLGLLKTKENGAPRIARVNPDLRDRFSKLVQPGNEKHLQAFLDGEKDLDKAYVDLQVNESEAETREHLVDLDGQVKYLVEVNERLQTLPIPKILETQRESEFQGHLMRVAKTAQAQERILTPRP